MPEMLQAAGDPTVLSVVIKTLNEERRVGHAIESALAAEAEIAPLELEVVVADSRSDDATAEVAARYPVRVVRMRSIRDRGCGAGVQLGFAASRGGWVYLMDGDMRLAPGFLAEALARLRADTNLGGVGGAVVDTRIVNAFDRIRVNNRSGQRSGAQRCLEGGGLYRRSAIAAAGGHAADRNLRGYEEAELGFRLRAAGYRLERLGRQAVQHEGHALGTWSLMRRHWQSRRAMSIGVLLRGAIDKPWRRDVLRLMIHPIMVAIWWALLALLVGLALALGRGEVVPALMLAWLLCSGAAFVALALLKRDARHAVVSVASWHYALAAAVKGCFEPRVPVNLPIDAEVVHDAPAPQRGIR